MKKWQFVEDLSFNQLFNKASIPDKSASDFYCDMCDSHMHNLQIWEAHIRGKRHLSNIKKLPGDRPSELRTIPMNDRNSVLLDRLKYECFDEPIVDLSFNQLFNKASIPDKSASDFYCDVCDSHMHSLYVWEAHIGGKRHLSNIKKLPGEGYYN